MVSSATEAAAEDRSAGPFELTFETCRPPEEEDLPGGRRFGTLVHAVLRDVPLDGDRASVEDLARLGARVVGAPEVEREAAVAGVLACLAHPVMRRAAAAKRCHRELPVMVRGEQGELIEGVIDLAFEEEDGWVVVDFKVTADLKQQQVLYENQLSWYVRALAEGTGKVVEAWLLGV